MTSKEKRKAEKILNPMELYSAMTGKHISDEFDIILKHDLFTIEEKNQRLYELFCSLHSDWTDYMGIKNANKFIGEKKC